MFYSIEESLISKTFSSKVDEATELDFEWFLVFFERFLVTICGKQVAEGIFEKKGLLQTAILNHLCDCELVTRTGIEMSQYSGI